MRITWSMKGHEELQRKLKALPAAISEDVLEAAARAGARIVRDAAETKAPRSTANKEHMADNITVKTMEKDGAHVVVGISPRDKFFYWHMQEYGTSKMAANPFLRPAMDENREEAKRAVANVLRGQIEKVAR